MRQLYITVFALLLCSQSYAQTPGDRSAGKYQQAYSDAIAFGRAVGK